MWYLRSGYIYGIIVGTVVLVGCLIASRLDYAAFCIVAIAAMVAMLRWSAK